jgi:hypothetical protein
MVVDLYKRIPVSTAFELINENMIDDSARYLMLISKGDITFSVLDKFITLPKDQKRVLVGSNFENDVNKEEYGYRSLSDIILYAEKGFSIIFKGMEHIYSSLYDLFNQNF